MLGSKLKAIHNAPKQRDHDRASFITVRGVSPRNADNQSSYDHYPDNGEIAEAQEEKDSSITEEDGVKLPDVVNLDDQATQDFLMKCNIRDLPIGPITEEQSKHSDLNKVVVMKYKDLNLMTANGCDRNDTQSVTTFTQDVTSFQPNAFDLQSKCSSMKLDLAASIIKPQNSTIQNEDCKSTRVSPSFAQRKMLGRQKLPINNDISAVVNGGYPDPSKGQAYESRVSYNSKSTH